MPVLVVLSGGTAARFRIAIAARSRDHAFLGNRLCRFVLLRPRRRAQEFRRASACETARKIDVSGEERRPLAGREGGSLHRARLRAPGPSAERHVAPTFGPLCEKAADRPLDLGTAQGLSLAKRT